jgi:RNA polymerase sigma factor (sigma-70 family)
MVDPSAVHRTDDSGAVPDTELLGRHVTEKSEAAFAEIVQRHLDFVYSAALRRVGGDAHAAADVTQQVFIALARQATTLARGVVLPAWLYATTRNVAVDFVRAEQRRRAREMEAALMQQGSGNTESVAEWERVRPLLDGAMDELTTADREAVLLRFFAQRPFAEIGRALHVSEDAARMRVDRALDRLRLQLAKLGITSSTAALGLTLSDHAVMAAPAGLGSAVATNMVAANAVSGAVTTFQLMSVTKIVALAAGLAALLTVGLAVRSWRGNRVAFGDHATAMAETERLAAQVRALTRAAAEAEQNLTVLEQPPVSAPDTGGSPGLGVAPTDPMENGRNFLAQHPDAAGLVLEAMRVGVRRDYQLLFHTLRLAPAQVEQFVAIMAESNAGLQWNTAAQVPFAKIDIGAKPSAEERDARLRAVLGDTNFDQYLDFRRARGARNLAEEIVRNAMFSAPVSATDARLLTEMLARQSPDYRAGRNFSMSNFDWDQAMTEARSVLGDRGLTTLAAVRERMDATNAVNRVEREVRDAAKRAAGFPPSF